MPGPDLMQGKLKGRAFKVARFSLKGLTRVLIGMKVIGEEHVPREGGVLVVSNHLHNADPVLVCIAIPRPLHYMAKKELMPIPVIGRVIRFSGAFPVDRGKADRNAIRMAGERLTQGIAVGMFPEGTRSVSRTIERALPGAGLIALRGNVPILPVAITGSEDLPFNGSKQGKGQFRRPRVTIRIGEPFMLEPGADGKRMSPDAAIDLAMAKVAEMLPESYRGIYATGATISS
jgi:1-acyl-sn-glycerol-3-phosphate acyltransferase